MSASAAENDSFVRRIDLLTLLSSLVTLFLALASDPWWTLSGANISRLFNIQVSPFYLHIAAVGLPATLAIAISLGAVTRVLIFLGSVALLAASIKPTAWWRNLAVYFGVSMIAELYLSFSLMYYWAQTTLVQAYGITPPYYGTTTLKTGILGLDLNYYPNPVVTATFALPYYLSFLGATLVLGRFLIKLLRERALQLLAALLPGGGVHDVYLTPPYQHVWFSSGDRQFNPLGTNPEALNDDELLVSFQKLYETVEPGGSLSIILPAWATSLSDRFQRLIPSTGFTVESAGMIYRTQGKPENELRFRRPIHEQEIQSPSSPTNVASRTEQVSVPKQAIDEEAIDSGTPPVVETGEEPVWINVRMTRSERAILKSALGIITEHREPVPYRELLNQVYMELLERKIDFDSARQIVTTLLSHNGKEILLVEERDEANARVIRKWWLGDQHLINEGRGLPVLEIVRSDLRKLPKIRKIFHRTRPRYKPRNSDDDTSPETTG